MKKAAVLGAGIVGLASAIHLRRRGFSVAVVDRAGPGEGASSGNAGIIATSAVAPVSSPGLLWKIPPMLLDKNSPLSLDWAHVLRNATWFAAYLRHGRESEARRIAGALSQLLRGAVAEHRELSGDSPQIKDSDLLYVYPNRRCFKADSFAFGLRDEQAIPWSELAAEELRELEPDLSPEFTFGIRLPLHGVVSNPLQLARSLAESFSADGGEIIRAEALRIEPEKRQIIAPPVSLSYDVLVVAAGAQSAQFAEQAGVRAPLLSERGYHMHFRNPGARHRHAMQISAGKCIATPMEDGMRVAGIVEFKPDNAPLDSQVAARLKRHARRLFPSARLEDASEWVGCRPSLPDSLPVIGASPRHPNIFFAFGHQHIGLTAAPKTGKLIAQLVAGEKPETDVAPFNPARFAA